ncbi:hypothetical protein GCM10027169_18410 [Gordonia jinhuaensis]|uniref:Uncharacterized protein n=1 Tax=Gordonia jinhuaensis TaxID=1517702 RepID=A0A916X1L9_9ACTN|nr:hypothetical protein [Gordonia jinhuaensis]GGB46647.1 hypothetical protein GCM10011489_37420 [Gordonia jinhuaensis]
MTHHGNSDDGLVAKAAGLLGLAGAGQGSYRPTIKTDTVSTVAKFVDDSGVVEMIETWRDEDDPNRKVKGGRPTVVDFRTVLVLLFLLALHDEPLLMTRMSEMLRHRLNNKTLRLLGLPRDMLPDYDPDSVRRDPLYFAVRRTLRSLLDVIDPAPGTPGRRLPKPEVDKIKAARDPQTCERKQARLLTVANTLLESTLMLLPAHVLKQWHGNLCVDATPLPLWGKRGTPRKATTDFSVLCSPHSDAGFYTREADHRDDGGRRKDKSIWAHELTLAIMAANTPGSPVPFPLLVIAMTMDRPSGRVAENAMACVRSIHERGWPAGNFVGDRAYQAGSKAEKLQLPLRALGYDLVTDYRKDQLGIHATHAGANQVEGHWYCPSMPDGLVNATIDLRAGRIDEDVYADRIERRAAYLLRPKNKPDADGHVPMRCPAVGASATVACPLKPKPPKTGADGKKKTEKTALGMPTILKPPVDPPGICTNKQSTTFGPEQGAKFAQSIRYGTPEWHEHYAGPRNTIEGFNGFVKDPAYGDLADAGRRRIIGYAAQFLLAAVSVASANVRKIWTWLRKGTTEPVTLSDHRARKADRRRRKTSLADYLPAPNAPPGIGPPAERPAAAS